MLLSTAFYSFIIWPRGSIPVKEIYQEGEFDFINESKVYYTTQGQGKPLILIHGFGASTFTWRRNIDYLASKGFKIWALDQKGFGLSDKPASSEYSLKAQARLIKEFMDKKHVKKAVLVGSSMGGAVLINFATLYPQRAEKIILIDSAGYQKGPPRWIASAPLKPFLKMFVRATALNKTIFTLTARRAYYNNKIITPELIDGYYLPLRTPGAEDVLYEMVSQNDLPLVRNKIKKVKAPTLIIWGKEDKIIPVKNAYWFHRDIKRSRLVIIEKCGHSPQEEKPAQVNRLITEFARGETHN